MTARADAAACPFCGHRAVWSDSPGALITHTTGCPVYDAPPPPATPVTEPIATHCDACHQRLSECDCPSPILAPAPAADPAAPDMDEDCRLALKASEAEVKYWRSMYNASPPPPAAPSPDARLVERLRERADKMATSGNAAVLREAAAALAARDAEVARLTQLQRMSDLNYDALEKVLRSREKNLADALIRAERAEAERDAAFADAARYQWLRDTLHGAKAGGGVEVNDKLQVYEKPADGEEVRVYWYPDTPVGFCEFYAPTLDAAIDGARAQENC